MTGLIWQRVIQQSQRLSALLTFLVLVLVTLACNIMGQTNDRAIVIRTLLPTLTVTRMPTLTPTTGSNSESSVDAGNIGNSNPLTTSPPISSGVVSATSISTPTPLPTYTKEPVTTPVPHAIETPSAEEPPAIEDSTITAPSNSSEAALPTETIPATSSPTPTSTATPTEIPTATHTPAPTATAVPNINTPGWGIAGIRLSTEQFDDRLALYGNLINNTGSAQEIASITGTFRNAEGQDIANAEHIIDYWPLEVIPPGAQMPFELTVRDIQSAASFDLRVVAKPSGQTLRQDFEFSELDQWAGGSGEYCVAGKIENLGDGWEGAWQGYLVIVVTLYDSQDNVISFGEEGSIAGGATLPFEICSQTFNQEVARYELGAWER